MQDFVAPVKPRVISPETGEMLPLEELIQSVIEERERGVIRIVGQRSAGKTTALKHLQTVLRQSKSIRFMDDATPTDVATNASVSLIICSSLNAKASIFDPATISTYHLAPWGQDELIEYLLAVHPGECMEVMSRIQDDDDIRILRGNPGLCRLVLDRLASDKSVIGIKQALWAELSELFEDKKTYQETCEFCLNYLIQKNSDDDPLHISLSKIGLLPEQKRLMRHEYIQIHFAAIAFEESLKSQKALGILDRNLPSNLVFETSERIKNDETILGFLHDLIASKKRGFHAMTASLLHVMDVGWKPQNIKHTILSHGYFRHAEWSAVSLSRSILNSADLSFADLNSAILDKCEAQNVKLHGSSLKDASLLGFHAPQSDFSYADLSNVNANGSWFQNANFESASLQSGSFVGCQLIRADLCNAKCVQAEFGGADLSRAKIEGADFTDACFMGATLNGLKLSDACFSSACFQLATMISCNLEFTNFPNADFEQVNLCLSVLTGSVMKGANFQSANLQATGLADIDWEGADLRKADLRRSTFYMGSSRSGLVDSPIASEGTRTGFYSDEYGEQHFKAPEEIRKANLCGANLTGADITDVDFYLVDLRGAIFSEPQRQHFERCGAILEYVV